MLIRGYFHTAIGWMFHIQSKEVWRKVMEQPPETADIRGLKELEFDEGLLTDDGEGTPHEQNYRTLEKIVNAYLWVYKSYEPGYTESILVPKVTSWILALMRNDQAYQERGYAMLFRVIAKYSPDNPRTGEAVLEDVLRWWDSHDSRARTQPWIRWVFDYILSHMDEPFYARSVWFLLAEIYKRRFDFVWEDTFACENWFSNGRGEITLGMEGGE